MPDSNKTTTHLTKFERSIAARMMLSFRYFCESETSLEPCKTPMTQLPSMLADLIRDTNLGGVVLFSENLESHQQILQLTADLQLAASHSYLANRLLIGIDQEGGRVVRLPRELSTAFSGNMAIGATYPKKGTYYARQVGDAIGRELNALGINLNFAPDVDVNINPDNPVINVRSFGQDPQRVGELGMAMMDAMQAQGVIATLKHFPGHGNTSIDSHTGLPLIDYTHTAGQEKDLRPFKQAIEGSNPGMIMTAHIQYPSLDGGLLRSKEGEMLIKPATMSQRILTQLLRNELGFKGIIITDALNMASISRNFEPVFATSQSLLAGADIALMPFRIRSPVDIVKFKVFVQQVAAVVLSSSQGAVLHQQSLRRLKQLSQQYFSPDSRHLDHMTAAKTLLADNILASPAHRKLQRQLAFDSITEIKNSRGTLIRSQLGKRVHFLLQDRQQAQLVSGIFKRLCCAQQDLKMTFSIQSEESPLALDQAINQADSLVVFYSERRESAVVQGEFEAQGRSYGDLEKAQKKRLSQILRAIHYAKQQQKTAVTIGMQSPYELSALAASSDIVLVAYDAAIFPDLIDNNETGDQVFSGVTYDAAVSLLLGLTHAQGQLPIALPLK